MLRDAHYESCEGRKALSVETYRPSWNRHRKVLIAQDDVQLREQLRLIFKYEGFHTLVVENLSDFDRTLETQRPDLAIVGNRFNGTDMIEVLPILRMQHRGLSAIVTMDEPSVEETVRALKAGAHNAFSTPINSEAMLTAARDILRQSVVVVKSGSDTKIQINGFNTLTPRESQIFELLIEGKRNKEIGRILDISPRTVEVHRARIMAKIGARNTAEMIRIALAG